MSRRPDYNPSVPVYDLSGKEIHEWDDDAGQLVASYVQEGDDLTLISYTYRPYSEEEVVRNDNERVSDSIRERSIEFFVDGGKESMEQDIRDAAASGGGADPQVAVMARLLASSIDFATVTATDVVAIPDYVPEWSTLIGQKLKHNSPCVYEGTIYRASQDVTVQDIYPPDVAGESQYYPIEVAPDGVIVYRTCHGQYDMVHKGERRHYPGADGPVYEALENTEYSPDAYPQHWKLVGDADTE